MVMGSIDCFEVWGFPQNNLNHKIVKPTDGPTVITFYDQHISAVDRNRVCFVMCDSAVNSW